MLLARPVAKSARRPRRILAQATTLLLVLSGLPACGVQAGAQARTYFIDYDHGSDQASGLAETEAWKHAPGDPEAHDGPQHAHLSAGDTVRFKGGVVYRGTIRLQDSGRPGAPITYSGEGFGAGKAVLSGRDLVPVQVRACETSPGCAGLAAAGDLRVLDMPRPVRPSDQVVLDGRMLDLAQGPDQPDSFWYDDLKHYAGAARPDVGVTAGEVRLRSGFIRKTLGDAPIDDLLIHLWGQPNAVTSLRVETYDPAASALTVKIPNFQPYEDQSTLFALVNHPVLITRPYQFATLDRGARLVVKAPLPLGAGQVEVSRRGAAFTLEGADQIVIQGFDIQGYAGGETDAAGGSALFATGKPSQGVIFRNNDVHDLTSWAGAGAVQVSNITDVSIADNRFFRLWRGAGLMLGGKAQDVRVLRNSFDHVGRTGILVIRAHNVWIDHNRMTGLMAHHGNGISVYLDNQDVLISNNRIGETKRPITFEGGGAPGAEPNRIVIRRNLIRAAGPESAAVQSWGGPTRGVTIEGNVLLSPDSQFALKLAGEDQDVVVRRNLIAGLAAGGAPAANWVVRDNVFLADNYIVSPQAADAWEKTNKMPVFGFAGQATAIMANPPVAGVKACAALVGDNAPPAGLDWLGASDLAKLSKGVGPDDLCAP